MASRSGGGLTTSSSNQQQDSKSKLISPTNQKNISSSLTTTATSQFFSPAPLESAAHFLGYGDVILSILRRASLASEDDVVLTLLHTLIAKSNSSRLDFVLSEALNNKNKINKQSANAVINFEVLYQRLANPFLRCDSSDIGKSIELQYQAVNVLSSFSSSSSLKTNQQQIQQEENKSLENLEKVLKSLLLETTTIPSSQNTTVSSNKKKTTVLPPLSQRSLLNSYVWKGFAASSSTQQQLYNSPLFTVIEHIVSCCGSIRGLGQGKLLEQDISNIFSQQQGTKYTMDDVIRLLHSTLIRAVTEFDKTQAPSQSAEGYCFPAIWNLSSESATSSSSSTTTETTNFFLRPISIVLIIIQHLDSVIKQFVEDYFSRNEKNENSNNSNSSSVSNTPSRKTTATASHSNMFKTDLVSAPFSNKNKNDDQTTKTPKEEQAEEKETTTSSSSSSNFFSLEAQVVALLRLAGKCLEFIEEDFRIMRRQQQQQQQEQEHQQSNNSSSSTNFSQETLCVGVLRRVGALASHSSLPLIKAIFGRFAHYATVRSQLEVIERRLDVQKRFDICSEECVEMIISSSDKEEEQQEKNVNKTPSKKVQEQEKDNNNNKLEILKKEVSVLSPVTSLLFMVMPRVAENEIVPSWMMLMTNVLDSFDQKSKKHHTSILSLVDILVPFAETVLWAPSAFSGFARTANSSSSSTTVTMMDDKGDNIRLHCCFALSLASLSKKISSSTSNNNNSNNNSENSSSNNNKKQELLKLAEAFLKQIVHSDLVAEVAMPGAISTAAISISSEIHNTHQNQQQQQQSQNLATIFSNSVSMINKLKSSNKILERILKQCSRVIHVAFPVENILDLYRDVIVSQPSLSNLVQAAVVRTRRFGTLRRSLQQCVVEDDDKNNNTATTTTDSSSSATQNKNNNDSDNTNSNNNNSNLLLQQVRELDFSAIPPQLFITLRAKLIRKRQFDTLVALFEEVIRAEPEKHVLEIAVESLCMTHAQRIVYAFLFAKMKNQQQLSEKETKSSSSSTILNKRNNSNISSMDPGFAAIQVFSLLHRTLYQNCGGEMMESQTSSSPISSVSATAKTSTTNKSTTSSNFLSSNFPSGASIENRVVSLVMQGCQEKSQNSTSASQQQQKKDDDDTITITTSLFPSSIFQNVSRQDWFDVAFRLLTFVTESSSLRKYFVSDPKWKRSLLGIATMRSLAQLHQQTASTTTTTSAAAASSGTTTAIQQQNVNVVDNKYVSLFPASSFLSDPNLIIENLLMCTQTKEASIILHQVPTLNCDEMIMNYAIKAVAIKTLSELDNDFFPFGCRVAGVEPSPEDDFLFPLDTSLQIRLKPNQSRAERDRIREAFSYSPNPCLPLHRALASLCRDGAFRFRRCFDFAVHIYDTLAASCDRPAFQDLLVDLGSRILNFAIESAKKDNVFVQQQQDQDHADADVDLSAQEASLLSALFHVSRAMLLAGEERFYTFDRFQEPDTRAMAVKDLVLDLLDVGLTSAASHVALSAAGLVRGLDAIWLQEATKLASLGLVEEAATAVQRLDTTSGARSSTGQVLLPSIEHSPSAGLLGCFGAIRRDVLLSHNTIQSSTKSSTSFNSNNNNKLKLQLQQEEFQNALYYSQNNNNNNNKEIEQQQLLIQSSSSSKTNNNLSEENGEAEKSSSSSSVQQKYTLARTETLEMADRHKAFRETVVIRMIKEFCGIEGTLRMLVRQGRIYETVRVALATTTTAAATTIANNKNTAAVTTTTAVATASKTNQTPPQNINNNPNVLTPLGFAENVFYDLSVIGKTQVHEQLRLAMKTADSSLVVCRGLIAAISYVLDVAYRRLVSISESNSSSSQENSSSSASAAASSSSDAKKSSSTTTTKISKSGILQHEFNWLVWSHDHAAASRVALQLAAEAPDYASCSKFIDIAEDHATQSKLQPTGIPLDPTNIKMIKAPISESTTTQQQNQKQENSSQQQSQQQQKSSTQKENDQNEDEDDDENLFAPDGIKYPPCQTNVMDRLALLGRLRLQRNIIKLLQTTGSPKVQLGYYDLVTEEVIPETVRRLASTQYRNGEVLDVALKALLAISHPTAPILTTALRNIKQASKNDMAVAFCNCLISSPGVPSGDKDATLLECVKVLGPSVADGTSSSSSSANLVKDVDAAVDAISSDNYAHRCIAMLSCGRLQDAYKCAAMEAQSAPLVQEILTKCQQPPLSKLKQSKSVVGMCQQYLSFAKK